MIERLGHLIVVVCDMCQVEIHMVPILCTQFCVHGLPLFEALAFVYFPPWSPCDRIVEDIVVPYIVGIGTFSKELFEVRMFLAAYLKLV